MALENTVLSNRATLYFIFFLSIVYLFFLLLNYDFSSVFFFGLVGLVSSFFTRNMIIILFICLVITIVLNLGGVLGEMNIFENTTEIVIMEEGDKNNSVENIENIEEEDEIHDFVEEDEIHDFVEEDEIHDFVEEDEIHDFVEEDEIHDFVEEDEINDLVEEEDEIINNIHDYVEYTEEEDEINYVTYGPTNRPTITQNIDDSAVNYQSSIMLSDNSPNFDEIPIENVPLNMNDNGNFGYAFSNPFSKFDQDCNVSDKYSCF
jgi:hypothetical protein